MDSTATKSFKFSYVLKLTLLVLFLIRFLAYLWKRRWFYVASWKMNGPISFPLIGSAWLGTGTSTDIIKKVTTRIKWYAPPIRVWLGPEFCVVLKTPEEINRVLHCPDAIQKADFYRFLRSTWGGIFSIEDVKQWKINRKTIVKTFNQQIVNSYVEVFVEEANIMCGKVEKLVGQKEFDVFYYFYSLSLDIIGRTSLDIEINQQETQSELIECLDIMVHVDYNRMMKPWLHPECIFSRTEHGRISEIALKKLFKFILDNIEKKRLDYRIRNANSVDVTQTQFKSTMELLVTMQEKSGGISTQQIALELLTLLFAGSESSAITNSFAVMMLGMHQDLQERVYAELKEIFGDSDRPASHEDLQHMKLLDRVIKETMRLFPIGPLLGRRAMKDIDMKTYTIPKGSSIGILVGVLHRDPDVWEDPFRFDPDRFLPENYAKMKPGSYVPFSDGPRNCIGISFGMMSSKTLLSTVLRKYKVNCNCKSIEGIELKVDLMLRAKDGNFISLEYRK